METLNRFLIEKLKISNNNFKSNISWEEFLDIIYETCEYNAKYNGTRWIGFWTLKTFGENNNDNYPKYKYADGAEGVVTGFYCGKNVRSINKLIIRIYLENNNGTVVSESIDEKEFFKTFTIEEYESIYNELANGTN